MERWLTTSTMLFLLTLFVLFVYFNMLTKIWMNFYDILLDFLKCFKRFKNENVIKNLQRFLWEFMQTSFMNFLVSILMNIFEFTQKVYFEIPVIYLKTCFVVAEPFAFRQCGVNGTWLWGNWTNYTQCVEYIPPVRR